MYKSLLDSGLSQLVKTIKGPESNPILDHVYCTNLNDIRSLVTVNVGTSDRLPLLLIFKRLKFKKNSHTTIQYRNFKHFEEDSFIEDLKSVPRHVINAESSSNDILHVWSSLFTDILIKHAPFVTRRVKRNRQPPWWSNKIISARKERDRTLKQARRSMLQSDWASFRTARAKTVYEIRAAKIEYFKRIIIIFFYKFFNFISSLKLFTIVCSKYYKM